MFRHNFVQVDTSEKYDTAVITSSTISPSVAPSSSVQVNDTTVITSSTISPSVAPSSSVQVSDTTVTTSTTISPSIAPSSSVPIQENNSDLIRSVDVVLLGVAILFLAIALILRQKLASLKQQLDKSRKDREAQRNDILLLREQLAQLKTYITILESKLGDDEMTGPKDHSFPYTFDATIYRAPKSDEVLETCADMACVNISDQIFTIADGVSQAFNSARWAELLVQHITVRCDTPTLIESIPRIARLWDADCEEFLQNEDPHSFSRQKQLQGSQSTLASVHLFERNHDLCWRFHTIGDSLLVIVDSVDNANLVRRFMPFTKVEDFPSSPDILSTNAPHLRGHIKTFEFSASESQKLLLMTDALARYAVSHGSPGIDIASIFPFLGGSDADFSDWMQHARQNGLGDDDSTLIMIYPRNE